MYNFKNKTELAESIVDTTEVIKMLGVSKQYVSELIQKGKLNPIKTFKRDRIFLKKEVENFNKNR